MIATRIFYQMGPQIATEAVRLQHVALVCPGERELLKYSSQTVDNRSDTQDRAERCYLYVFSTLLFVRCISPCLMYTNSFSSPSCYVVVIFMFCVKCAGTGGTGRELTALVSALLSSCFPMLIVLFNSPRAWSESIVSIVLSGRCCLFNHHRSRLLENFCIRGKLLNTRLSSNLVEY